MTDPKPQAIESPAQAQPPAPAEFQIPPRLTRLARHRYPLLALLCLLLWLPGALRLPAIDRDESRFAQSSRQMLDSGDYVDIRFGQVPRYKKPVGIYWLQAAATALASPGGAHTHIWTYRLPSLLGGIAAVWLTVWAGSLFGAEAGLIAGFLLATSLLLTAEASMATTDAVLLAAIAAMQGVLLRLWLAFRQEAPAPSRRLVLAGWAAMAVGILIKGPVAPGVAAGTLILLCVWERQWRWLKASLPVRGLLLTVLLVAPWLIAISLQSHGAFLQQSLGGDFAAKVAGEQEGHGAPPGFYLALLTITFWPGILFLLPALGLAFVRKADASMRFLIAWAGGWWLVVELVPTKLPNYALPAYPALAIMAALFLLAPRDETGWRRFLPFVSAFQFVAALGLLAVAMVLLPKSYGMGPLDPMRDWPVAVGLGLFLLGGIATLILFLMGRRLLALAPMALAALCTAPVLLGLVGPGLSQIWVSERLAALVARDRQPSDPPPMLAGYEEPSMLFALGADIALTDGRGAAERGANQGGIALIQDDERPQFLARLAELEDSAVVLDDLSGFNYSRGKLVHITLYRVASLHAVPVPSVR